MKNIQIPFDSRLPFTHIFFRIKFSRQFKIIINENILSNELNKKKLFSLHCRLFINLRQKTQRNKLHFALINWWKK